MHVCITAPVEVFGDTVKNLTATWIFELFSEINPNQIKIQLKSSMIGNAGQNTDLYFYTCEDLSVK